MVKRGFSGILKQSNPGNAAGVCGFQHAGGGAQSYRWGNTASSSESPAGCARIAVELCPDTPGGASHRKAVSTRAVPERRITVAWDGGRRTVSSEVGSCRQRESRIWSRLDGVADDADGGLYAAGLAAAPGR